MASKENSKQYAALKTFFESNSVKKMRDLEKLYPTMVAKDLKINHGRYINKLFKPELFSYGQIFKLASLLEIDPKIISDVINSELAITAKTKTKKK